VGMIYVVGMMNGLIDFLRPQDIVYAFQT
jgi:hypothetical protein